MPTATVSVTSVFERRTRMCCFSTSVMVAKRFTVSVDGKAVIHGDLQYLDGNGVPNMENVRRDPKIGDLYRRATYILAYYMLKTVKADRMSSLRIAAAHAGVLYLRTTGFNNVTHHTGKFLDVAGQSMLCNDVDNAAALCKAAFLVTNPEVEISG